MSVISNDLIAQLDLSKLLSYFLPILVDTYFFSIRRRFYHSISLFLRRGPEQRPGCPSRPQSNRICPKLDFVLGCGGEFTNVWSTPAIPSLLLNRQTSRQGFGNTNLHRKRLLALLSCFQLLAGPAIPVVRTFGNTHDRRENVAALAASSVARSNPPTWHLFPAVSRKDQPRLPWQVTVLHPYEKPNSNCPVYLSVGSYVSEGAKISSLPL
ncbi:hypothetical protein E4T38_02983 [Aureobasidium subglaciale]|nr:hypothetical protein E4T38_02983 [Aureobasidium subglaciale]KAI5227342.1 hypothetical protein E4T40_02581 [Aureobasidium subglaciale]KAI5230506.1 hypothetical protein E4T41_02982 [Aureobasidium subglaciale]KAI5265001.1 hypothetical protein E4T46_02760 [Aureobasidium subglaciale]